jgi:hypothetical protein
MRLAVLSILTLGIGSPAHAQLPGERLVGSGDLVPNRPGSVFQEVSSPQLAGEWVIARGWWSNQAGVYVWQTEGGPGLEVLGPGLQLPGLSAGATLLTQEARYDINDQGNAAVVVGWEEGETEGVGVWAWVDGVPEKVILSGELAIGSTAPFQGVGRLLVEDDDIYVLAHEGDPLIPETFRVYRWDAVSRQVTSIIALPADAVIQSVWLYQNRLYVHGDAIPSDPRLWSFDRSGGDMRLEYDFPTPFPGSPPGTRWRPNGFFAPFFSAFAEDDPLNWGFFRLNGPGVVDQLFGPGSLDPTTGQPFSAFGGPGPLSGDTVSLFISDLVGPRLVVMEPLGEYHVIVGQNADFEGSEVVFYEWLLGGLDEGQIAFGLGRANGDIAVWITRFERGAVASEIPTTGPIGLVLIASALGFVGAFVLTRRSAQ